MIEHHGDDDTHSKEELAAWKEKALDYNQGRDAGFGYFGPLEDDKWATFPFGNNDTQHSDAYAIANWEFLQELMNEVTTEETEDDVQVEEYKHWVGSIRIRVLRFNTENEAVLRRSLTLFEEMEEGWGWDISDKASEVEMRLAEEAWDDDPSLKEMVTEWLTQNVAEELERYGQTPESYVEENGLRLAEDAMRYHGEMGYINEEGLEWAWRDAAYELRYDYERAQPPQTKED